MVSDTQDAQDLVVGATKLRTPDGKGDLVERPGFTFNYSDEEGNKYYGSVAVAPVVDFRGNEILMSIYD